ncbi:MAG: 5-(carboxyamino)imidazole ribonucleotide synthase [Pirellulaceae bacterium]|nr:5-(carboxyamino)imidazole ribonucleotide synthase [Pirellulaceae bacterium]
MKKTSSEMILPGGRLGVFGGGQLGRMFAHAAQRLGYHVVVFTPESDSPAGQVAQETVQADYEDPKAVRRFAEMVDVITLEFENIDTDAVARAEEIVSVRPGLEVLKIAQHRIREKSTLQQAGFPVTPFHELRCSDDIAVAASKLGFPMVFKTAQWGYDGKGQRKVSTMAEAMAAFELLGPSSVIAEQRIDFAAEVSLIVARSPRGEVAVYPLFYNEHANHILDVTMCPAPEAWIGLAAEAGKIGRGVAESLDVIGLLTIEFFVDQKGQLMINELAPRPHNSGHLTMEACSTSQFEQQVRAICNLPLGDTSLIRPAAMANLLGDVWNQGQPAFGLALADPQAYLHLYGKQDARTGRKMGHLTCLDASSQAAAVKVRALRDQLRHSKGELFE